MSASEVRMILKSDQGPITTTPSENAIWGTEASMGEKLQRGLWNYFRLALRPAA
jgi:hypothetical protein